MSPLLPPLPSLQPYVLSMAFCPLYGPLSLLLPSVPYSALHPLQPFIASLAFCPLYSPLSSLQPFVPSTAPCSLYDPLPLYSPLSPLQPSAPSIALCPFLGPVPSAALMILFKTRYSACVLTEDQCKLCSTI
jgi:hypothetical protein